VPVPDAATSADGRPERQSSDLTLLLSLDSRRQRRVRRGRIIAMHIAYLKLSDGLPPRHRCSGDQRDFGVALSAAGGQDDRPVLSDHDRVLLVGGKRVISGANGPSIPVDHDPCRARRQHRLDREHNQELRNAQ
jgi:hypothetical protein